MLGSIINYLYPPCSNEPLRTQVWNGERRYNRTIISAFSLYVELRACSTAHLNSGYTDVNGIQSFSILYTRQNLFMSQAMLRMYIHTKCMVFYIGTVIHNACSYTCACQHTASHNYTMLHGSAAPRSGNLTLNHIILTHRNMGDTLVTWLTYLWHGWHIWDMADTLVTWRHLYDIWLTKLWHDRHIYDMADTPVTRMYSFCSMAFSKEVNWMRKQY